MYDEIYKWPSKFVLYLKTDQEAAPLEQAFSVEKKEQQRRWLQDLEQQREETKQRRKLEKQSQNQVHPSVHCS